MSSEFWIPLFDEKGHPLPKAKLEELLPLSPVTGLTEPSFTIFSKDGKVYVKEGSRGRIVFVSSDAAEAIQWAANQGGLILIKRGMYPIFQKIDIPSEVCIVGEGMKTHLVSYTPVAMEINRAKYGVYIGNLWLTGQRKGGDIGIVIRNPFFVFIDKVNLDFFNYCIYICSPEGNLIELKDITTANCDNSIAVNGANHLHIINPQLVSGTTVNTSGMIFLSLLGDSVFTAGNIKVYGGQINTVETCLRWPAGVQGFLAFYGTLFESFKRLVSVEANQAGNLYIHFYSTIAYCNKVTTRILHGENLSQLSAVATFSNCFWCGPVDPSFVFCDQPDFYISFFMEGYHKFTAGFPTVRTRSFDQATITAGSTYVDVPHNLARPPRPGGIQVTPLTNLGGRSYWVSNITPTTFRINISSPDTVDHVFYWFCHA